MKKISISTILVIGLIVLGVFYNIKSAKAEKEALKKEELQEAADSLEAFLEEEFYVEYSEVADVEVYAYISSEEDSSIDFFVRFFDRFDTYSKENKAYIVHKTNLLIKEVAIEDIVDSPLILDGENSWFITINYETNSNYYSEYEHSIILNDYALQEYIDQPEKD